MSLRKRLDKKGYILVSKVRMKILRHAYSQQYREDREQSAWATRAFECEDQIKILEAEIEAHKRVEAVLAERSIELP